MPAHRTDRVGARKEEDKYTDELQEEARDRLKHDVEMGEMALEIVERERVVESMPHCLSSNPRSTS